MILLPPNSPLVDQRCITAADIAEHGVISPGDADRDRSIGYEYRRFMRDMGTEPSSGYVTPMPTTIIAFARAGLGIGLISLLATRLASTSDIVVRPLPAGFDQREVGVFWDRSRERSAPMDAFLSLLMYAKAPESCTPIART